MTPKPKADLDHVWTGVLGLISAGPTPMPYIPYPSIKLTDAELDKIRGDMPCKSGMPLTECLLKPSHARLLYKIIGLNRKNKEDREPVPSDLLRVLHAFEGSSDEIGQYYLNIADIINDKRINTFSENGGYKLIKDAKTVLYDCLGLVCTSKRYDLRLVTREVFEESRYYHDRNLKKSGYRALQFWRVAHTRYLLGDQEALIDEDYKKIIERGNLKYEHIILGRPDSTRKIPAGNRPPRHLL